MQVQLLLGYVYDKNCPGGNCFFSQGKNATYFVRHLGENHNTGKGPERLDDLPSYMCLRTLRYFPFLKSIGSFHTLPLAEPPAFFLDKASQCPTTAHAPATPTTNASDVGNPSSPYLSSIFLPSVQSRQDLGTYHGGRP